MTVLREIKFNENFSFLSEELIVGLSDNKCSVLCLKYFQIKVVHKAFVQIHKVFKMYVESRTIILWPIRWITFYVLCCYYFCLKLPSSWLLCFYGAVKEFTKIGFLILLFLAGWFPVESSLADAKVIKSPVFEIVSSFQLKICANSKVCHFSREFCILKNFLLIFDKEPLWVPIISQ